MKRAGWRSPGWRTTGRPIHEGVSDAFDDEPVHQSYPDPARATGSCVAAHVQRGPAYACLDGGQDGGEVRWHVQFRQGGGVRLQPVFLQDRELLDG